MMDLFNKGLHFFAGILDGDDGEASTSKFVALLVVIFCLGLLGRQSILAGQLVELPASWRELLMYVLVNYLGAKYLGTRASKEGK